MRRRKGNVFHVVSVATQELASEYARAHPRTRARVSRQKSLGSRRPFYFLCRGACITILVATIARYISPRLPRRRAPRVRSSGRRSLRPETSCAADRAAKEVFFKRNTHSATPRSVQSSTQAAAWAARRAFASRPRLVHERVVQLSALGAAANLELHDLKRVVDRFDVLRNDRA